MEIKGIKEAAAVTKGLKVGDRLYVQISLDFETGELYTNVHSDENSYSDYHDNNIWTICTTQRGMSEETIMARIKEVSFLREKALEAEDGLIEP